MVIVYMLLLMLISDSFYSIKTAALMWFILGSSNAFDHGKELAERLAAKRKATAGPGRQVAA
jgi:putative polymerase